MGPPIAQQVARGPAAIAGGPEVLKSRSNGACQSRSGAVRICNEQMHSCGNCAKVEVHLLNGMANAKDSNSLAKVLWEANAIQRDDSASELTAEVHLCFMARRAPKTVIHWRPRKPRRAFLRRAPRTGSSSSGATISSSDESSLAARPRFFPVTCGSSNQIDVEPHCAELL